MAPSYALTLGLPALTALILWFPLRAKGFEPLAIGASLISLMIVLWFYASMAVTDMGERLRAKILVQPEFLLLVPLPVLAAYGIYIAGTGGVAWTSVAMVSLYFSLPGVFLWLKPPKTWFWDGLLVFSMWLPIELGLLKSGWSFPEGQGGAAYITSSATPLLAALMLAGRGLDGIGFRFRLSLADLKTALVQINLATLIMLPLGFGLGVFRWHPEGFSLGGAATVFFAGLLMVAIPEELLFRGVMWNLCLKHIKDPKVSALLALTIFALSHANNAAYPGGPVPDWRFVLLAGIAGFFYGRIWMKTGSILPGALGHALVNTIWSQFLQNTGG